MLVDREVDLSQCPFLSPVDVVVMVTAHLYHQYISNANDTVQICISAVISALIEAVRTLVWYLSLLMQLAGWESITHN